MEAVPGELEALAWGYVVGLPLICGSMVLLFWDWGVKPVATETPEPKSPTPNKWNKFAQEDIPGGHPTQEERNFHPLDQKLRAAGFRIEYRPAGKEAIWSKDRVEYRQSEAAERMAAQKALKAKG